MNKHFTHLHLHTDYSLLDGAISLNKLIDFGKQNNFKALAITDHGNIFGAVKFFQKCKKAGIKPILGIEAYLTEDVAIKDAKNKYYHLVLLVQNDIGYKNLCKLISYSFKKGFYFKPRIDYKILAQHCEGLIATSACLGGHIPRLLMQGKDELAKDRINWFLKHFGKDRFYLEVQPEDQKDQVILNKKLYELSKQMGISLLAAGDCHYVQEDDRQAHELLLSIQTHDKISNPNRYTFGDCRVHMRTQEQMLELFSEHPEAVWNSGKIADMCSFDFQTDKLFFPKFEIPQEHTQETFFRKKCEEGLQKLLDQKRIEKDSFQQYVDRLNVEMDLIISMGFIGYFLVVGDFIQWARKENIPVGPGRGSAAGSLIAWALEITNIDPLKYNLLFERFLNPERVSMPDIDIDFCINGREVVIDYVRDKYGHDNVCQIITFGTMMAKGVIKDAARALGIPFEDSNAITKLIPDQLKITLKEALEQEPRLVELQNSNPQVKKLFDLSFKLEGLTRHASKHAAGIVISPQPIDEVLPVYIPSKTTDLVTQYAMTELESIGFLKIDFLGLKNLTLIDKAVQLIAKNHGTQIKIDYLPLDDEKTFELLCQGKTTGVFQLESDGLKEVLQKLQPEKFEDIIAVNALYRPGPLGSGMVDDFIERKHGRQKIVYLFDELEPILKETYGVIVYQEQVMKIASAIAGFSLGQSDILRRAMGKKKVDVMAEQRELFIKKSVERKFDKQKAGKLFDLMAYFAGYGFNKSHSAAYAMIAYQTAYLKANYPQEFMACLISLESANADKMSFYLQETKQMGIAMLPPNINTSEVEFSVVDGSILFGLGGIKSVGSAALENILTERKKKPFLDLLQFCKRIDLRKSNKRVLEHLIYAGAFDEMPGSRAQQVQELQHIMDIAVDLKKAELTGQLGLFGGKKKNEDGTQVDELYAFQSSASWTDKESLEKEKEVIGFYLSSHPLQVYEKELQRLQLKTFTQALNLSLKTNSMKEPIVTVCGLLKGRRDIVTKKGGRMSFIQLEDESATGEIIVFPRLFKKVEEWLNDYQVFVVKGDVDGASDRRCKIKAFELVPVELFLQEWSMIKAVQMCITGSFAEDLIKNLKDDIVKGLVPLQFIFHENGKKIRLQTTSKIALNNDFIKKVEQQYGIEVSLVI